MNRVELIGYLGQDPDIHEYADGNSLAVIRLATDTFYKSEEGKTIKLTQWHTAKVWGKQQIENLRNYLIKGSHILINGELEYRTYQDRSGHTRYVTEIRVKYLVDLDR